MKPGTVHVGPGAVDGRDEGVAVERSPLSEDFGTVQGGRPDRVTGEQGAETGERDEDAGMVLDFPERRSGPLSPGRRSPPGGAQMAGVVGPAAAMEDSQDTPWVVTSPVAGTPQPTGPLRTHPRCSRRILWRPSEGMDHEQ
jgi:hypothetical protein